MNHISITEKTRRRRILKPEMKEHIIHPIPPFYDKESKILILGSFPSVKSREQKFFYGHPQNRFWKVLAQVFTDEVPNTVPEKKAFLKKHHIALWDVIGSCTVTGSADSSIKDVIPNDLSLIFSAADIKAVYLNGSLAFSLYEKYGDRSVPYFRMPSTSPANAARSIDALIGAWSVIRCML